MSTISKNLFEKTLNVGLMVIILLKNLMIICSVLKENFMDTYEY